MRSSLRRCARAAMGWMPTRSPRSSRSSPPRRTSRPSATTTGPRSRSRRPRSSCAPWGRSRGASCPPSAVDGASSPSARVAGSAVPAAGQVHAHPRHLRREGRRDLRVGLARRAGRQGGSHFAGAQEGAADDARAGQLPQRRHKQGRRVGLQARHALEAVRHKDGRQQVDPPPLHRRPARKGGGEGQLLRRRRRGEDDRLGAPPQADALARAGSARGVGRRGRGRVGAARLAQAGGERGEQRQGGVLQGCARGLPLARDRRGEEAHRGARRRGQGVPGPLRVAGGGGQGRQARAREGLRGAAHLCARAREGARLQRRGGREGGQEEADGGGRQGARGGDGSAQALQGVFGR
mmetsp:Transcript_16327/g.49239  ORF Transcript_16327/g.49239 Transcript_16327/m.49239 type:complete len:351 (-) Transcript_16327:1430-2482(-)